MLKDIAKCVMNGVAGVTQNEFKIINSNFIDTSFEVINGFETKLKIKECGFLVNRPVMNGSIIIKTGTLVEFVEKFRRDNIQKATNLLIGMELKRGCQYDREWIDDILFNSGKDEKLGDIVIKSSTGALYNAKNVRVYSSEENVVSLYDYSAWLSISDGAGIKT